MIDLRGIKVLIFDFGGVIINLNRAASVSRFQELGLHDADRLLSNYVQSGLFLQLESGMITPDEFHREVRTQYGLPNLADRDIDEALDRFLLDVPEEKLAALRHLKRTARNEKGERVRIVLLSNTNAIHFPACRKRYFESNGYTIDDYFDHLYLSYEMQMSKPDEEIFHTLLASEGCRAEECLFFDDGPQNIETAKRLGFRTYLVSERERWDRMMLEKR